VDEKEKTVVDRGDPLPAIMSIALCLKFAGAIMSIYVEQEGMKMKKENIVGMAKNVEDLLASFCYCGDLGLHGIDHLRRVAILSGRLAVAVGEDVESAVVMGFLHDSARRNDGGGNGHAHDSAVLARELIERFYPHLDVDRICEAIAGHADGEVV